MLNSSFSISSHPTENAVDAPLFLRPHLLPYRETFTLNYFFGLSSYSTENMQCSTISSTSSPTHREMFTLNYFFGLRSYSTENMRCSTISSASSPTPQRKVYAQLFLRTQLVFNGEHAMLHYFFDLISYPTTKSLRSTISSVSARIQQRTSCFSNIPSAYIRTQQRTPSMFNYFFGLSAYVTENMAIQ
jgi:hypothetical protein